MAEPVIERPAITPPFGRTLDALSSWAGSVVTVIANVIGQHGYRINRVLPKDGTEAMTAPLPLMTYTVATLPTAADYEGNIIYVSDGSAGENFRGSDGSTWVNLG
jgi:hypothetical protein